MTPGELARGLKAEAIRLGFDRVGIAPAITPPGYQHFLDWLDQGHAAGMAYLERNAAARGNPSLILEQARSVVMASVVYGRAEPTPADAGLTGKVARYARGPDYHRVLWDKLEALLGWLKAASPGLQGRAITDTAPLLERDFARLAGLGWIGKNTMLIDRRLGSFTFLGALVIDAELPPDAPHVASHCGTCTRCLDACPTDAFKGPYQLDARRCISYWTIEHKGPIAEEIAGRLDGWVFGCDVCQDVCPWNRKAPPGRMPELEERRHEAFPNLIEWLARDDDAWRTALKGTALSRAKRAGLLRNAAIVAGGQADPQALPQLEQLAADEHEAPGVREAAAWAVARINAGPPD